MAAMQGTAGTLEGESSVRPYPCKKRHELKIQKNMDEPQNNEAKEEPEIEEGEALTDPWWGARIRTRISHLCTSKDLEGWRKTPH